MSIGEKIRTARKNMGISQEALADKLGVSTQAVSTWERDENLPETKKLLAIAKALRLSLDYMVAEDRDDWTMKLLYPDRVLDRAIEYAVIKHSGMNRKGTNVPYIVHPMEAAAIVSALTDDEEVIAAAVLHDVLEDTDASYEELVQLFGRRIASLVADESEDKREGRAPEETWTERKTEALRHLQGACPEAKMIALGDKLANIRAMHRDQLVLGDAFWTRFNNANKADQAAYYKNLLRIFASDPAMKDLPLVHEFGSRVYRTFRDIYDAQDENGKSGLQIRWLWSDDMDSVRESSPEGAKAWALIMDRTEDADLKQIQIMAAIYDWFLRSDDVGFADTHLIITNDPGSHDVAWERTQDGYAVHLCAVSGLNWCQVGYQLGYAMMHCLIDHLNPDKPAISWAEELISEAAALELLHLLQLHWNETPFGKKDPDYVYAIAKYIDGNMSDKGTSALVRCADRAALDEINAANRFDDRINESHDLYSKIGDGDLLRLAEIRRYAADDLLLHTHFWRGNADGSQAVESILRIQEQIPGCEVPAGVSTEINLENSDPTDAQRAAYACMIRGLRDLPLEHVIFEFLNADKEDCEQIGLVFCQMARAGDHELCVELRLDKADGRHLYRLFCDDDRAVEILDFILVKNDVPDLTGWTEITDQVFPRDQAEAAPEKTAQTDGEEAPDPMEPPEAVQDSSTTAQFRLCHIYSVEDAREAGETLETEGVKGYGEETHLPGHDDILVHDNYECEFGGRYLAK